MSRPLKDEALEALERRLSRVEADGAELTAILHELSFRDGPTESRLKERAEETRIQLAIAQAQQRRSGDAATRDTADASAANRTAPVSGDLGRDLTSPSLPRDMHKDFPGFDSGPMLAEISTFRNVPSVEDKWRRPTRHLVVLAISIGGILGLVGAQLAGAFGPAQTEAAKSSYSAPAQAREVSPLPYIPMESSEHPASDKSAASTAGRIGDVTGAGSAGSRPQPHRPAIARPIDRINLTTDLANLYSGEGPQIARAAVVASGLGLNQTVRWSNEKSGRHGTVTLIAQNPQRASCYTAQITRLDTKTPQRRTQQLCF
jgi:hypothetical protein